MAPRLAGLAIVPLVVVGWALAPALASPAQEPTRLDAVVGTNDGFDISLNDASGARVTDLSAGTYTIVVHDRSKLHNFHLASNFDSTVDFRTDVEFVGDQSFAVTFRASTLYAYACEPHFQTMNGRFFVTGATPTTTTSGTPPRTRIVATLSASGAAALTPRVARRGAARIVVRDRSAKTGFRLVGPGLSRATGKASTGTATWNVTLRPGTYRFGAQPGKLTGSLRVRD